MLVLLSFGLVLLATILLVVGLLNDDGIGLIYFSIAASATAAFVLYLAFRRARPEGAAAASGPAPLDRDLDAIVHDTDGGDVTAVTPAAAPPPPAVEPPAPTTVVAPGPADEPTGTGTGDEAWADDADWEVDDLEFPIADYDELSVAEIMPLLPQLYSDELDVVYEREQRTKNRATILARLDKLKETGTDADAEEAGLGDVPAADLEDAGAGAAEDLAPADEPEPEPDDALPAVEAPAPASRTMSLLDDDEDDDTAFFPIADYDDLSVSQIIPLLPQLESDELEDVRAREVSGANRATLVAEIDRHLGVGVSTPAWSAAAEEPVGIEELDEVDEPAVATTPSDVDDRDRLPIHGYDTMTVAEIRPRLAELSDTELEQVLRYEEARDNRRTIVSEIQRRLMAGDPVVTSSSAPDPAPAPPARRAPRKAGKAARKASKAPAEKAAKAPAKATRKAASKAPAKRATKKAAGTRNSTRFPIANYDELTVAEIRPRLSKLSRSQLEKVRERELSGAGRRTILNDIDARLR